MQYKSMDINADAGESFGNFVYGNDEKLMPYLTSVNVACGFHSGDPSVMRRTICLAKTNGVAVGAHVGFPDLLGFGRRIMEISPEEMRDYVVYQVGALKAFAEAEGIKLHHVGPHGSLAGWTKRQPAVGKAFIEGVCEVSPDVVIMGRPGLPIYENAKAKGMRTASQVALDLEYNPDCTSVIQRQKQVASVDRAIEKLTDILKEGIVRAIDGTILPIPVDTVLIHSDTPNAVEICAAVKKCMVELGVTPQTF
jgi:UPF0271 protein